MARAARTAGLIVAVLGFGVVGAQAGQELAAARQADLMNLLVQDCGSCHGLTMKGGLGSPLLPKTLDGKDAASLAEIILDGIPDTPMPAWRGQLSAAEALWMARQLKQGIK